MNEKTLKVVEKLKELLPKLDDTEKMILCTYAQGMANCSEAVRVRREREKEKSERQPDKIG